MWEEGICIYGTPRVHNNFPKIRVVMFNMKHKIINFKWKETFEKEDKNNVYIN